MIIYQLTSSIPSQGNGRQAGTATNKEANLRRQIAALPTRTRKGKREVLLVTTRETRRWMIPKGWPMRGHSARSTAGREARQEAGVIGRIGRRPIGSFRYEKRLSADNSVFCEVVVYLLDVHKQLKKWPEMGSRERCWLAPIEAAERVISGELRSLLLQLDAAREQPLLKKVPGDAVPSTLAGCEPPPKRTKNQCRVKPC